MRLRVSKLSWWLGWEGSGDICLKTQFFHSRSMNVDLGGWGLRHVKIIVFSGVRGRSFNNNLAGRHSKISMNAECICWMEHKAPTGK